MALLLAERGDDPALELEELVPACRRVHEALGVEISPGKPILGERAFRHESGMHTAAMLQEPSTYEPFAPDTYGGQRRLLFGADTDRGAVRALLADADIEPTEGAVADALAAIESAAESRGRPLDEAEARQVVQERRGDTPDARPRMATDNPIPRTADPRTFRRADNRLGARPADRVLTCRGTRVRGPPRTLACLPRGPRSARG